MRNIGYSVFGKGPQRRTACYKKVYRKGPTELHRDFCSFGHTNRSSRLPDGEFALQVGKEIGYFGGKGARHFGRAVRSLGGLLRLIFA